MSDTRQHLNSLGYVIGSKQSRALIAWGYDAAGQRVRVEDADRGGSQGLLCECKTALVAKKGDIREHHFAHKAGDVRHCEVATKEALSRFLADALLDAGRIALPSTQGKIGYAEVNGVTPIKVDGCVVHLVDAQRDRKLVVFARVKRQSLEPLEGWCRANCTSGMMIDLSVSRNRTDDKVREAVAQSAERRWVFRVTSNDHLVDRELIRRMFG